MDMSLNILWEIAEDRDDWCTAVHEVAKTQTWLSDWTTKFADHIQETLEGKWVIWECSSLLNNDRKDEPCDVWLVYKQKQPSEHVLWAFPTTALDHTGQGSEHQTKHGVRVHLSHWFSNFRAHQNHLEDLVAQDCRAHFQSFWTRRTGARGLFLTSSQVMLMLLWWAQLEDHWSTWCTGLSHAY